MRVNAVITYIDMDSDSVDIVWQTEHNEIIDSFLIHDNYTEFAERLLEMKLLSKNGLDKKTIYASTFNIRIFPSKDNKGSKIGPESLQFARDVKYVYVEPSNVTAMTATAPVTTEVVVPPTVAAIPNKEVKTLPVVAKTSASAKESVHSWTKEYKGITYTGGVDAQGMMWLDKDTKVWYDTRHTAQILSLKGYNDNHLLRRNIGNVALRGSITGGTKFTPNQMAGMITGTSRSAPLFFGYKKLITELNTPSNESLLVSKKLEKLRERLADFKSFKPSPSLLKEIDNLESALTRDLVGA